jgi:hypothetical protein
MKYLLRWMILASGGWHRGNRQGSASHVPYGGVVTADIFIAKRVC